MGWLAAKEQHPKEGVVVSNFVVVIIGVVVGNFIGVISGREGEEARWGVFALASKAIARAVHVPNGRGTEFRPWSGRLSSCAQSARGHQSGAELAASTSKGAEQWRGRRHRRRVSSSTEAASAGAEGEKRRKGEKGKEREERRKGEERIRRREKSPCFIELFFRFLFAQALRAVG